MMPDAEPLFCRLPLLNVQIMQPSENGVLVMGRRTSPAYAPAFVDAVKEVTGARYVKP